jgi:hypothetical protein
MCAQRTKRLSYKFSGYKSNCIECDRSTTSLDYAHIDLYNQMKFFKYIFDADAYKNIYKTEFSSQQASLNSDLNIGLKELKDFSWARIKRNAYGIVNLKTLFCNF